MKREKDELWSGSTYLGRWRVFTKPGAAIEGKVLEMSDELRRWLTLEGGGGYLPPPQLDRWT